MDIYKSDFIHSSNLLFERYATKKSHLELATPESDPKHDPNVGFEKSPICIGLQYITRFFYIFNYNKITLLSSLLHYRRRTCPHMYTILKLKSCNSFFSSFYRIIVGALRKL